jgi:hypothetical protein
MTTPTAQRAPGPGRCPATWAMRNMARPGGVGQQPQRRDRKTVLTDVGAVDLAVPRDGSLWHVRCEARVGYRLVHQALMITSWAMPVSMV